MATQTYPHPAAERIDLPVSGYCIEHAGGNILFDLGCHPDAMGADGRWTAEMQDLCPHSGGEECQLPNRLEQIGLGPDDIRYAVLSHLHNDHAGCVEFFRKTKLIVHEDEFAGAFRTFGLREHGTPYVLADIGAWARCDLDWQLVTRETSSIALADDIEILNFGSGHARGMLGLHVRTRELGSVILASDVAYGSGVYGPPVRLPGVTYDTLGAERAIERLRNLAHQYKAQVWFGHDPDQFATLRASTAGFYE
ncbi:N-acyl homoserine lactonase family protein [Acidisoma silvae]|uniref:N-acyl homoserine lactonase family protein n=1 Tax=Acidisoma silvae TaxID=2802396 RepID=A0A963YXC9_9PROT|nr:N-acyl homoserine lactonase family protein [Acidisoma silvae]MCB8877883.1 N-acyl homoserine lactonase family protein [Acidisoma silvae]